MAKIPGIPNIPGGGLRQQRAAQLKAELEAEQQEKQEAAQPAEDDKDELSAGPVGQGDYRVKQGDCISSIAKDKGHFWEKIWNDPANAELKEVRKNPNVLLPDDRVTIPQIRRKQEPGETEIRHRFVRRGEPAFLRLQVLDDDRPLANQPYELKVDGETLTGTTDPEGKLEVEIKANARRAKLIVGAEEPRLRYALTLGGVDPIDSMRGVQQRLHNLGYPCPTSGEADETSQTALFVFQKKHGLQETGEADGPTRQKLKEKHKS